MNEISYEKFELVYTSKQVRFAILVSRGLHVIYFAYFLKAKRRLNSKLDIKEKF